MKSKVLFCVLLLGTSYALKAQIVITGTIKSLETGEGVSSATIAVKGKNTAAVAPVNGAFNLTIKALPVTLVISHFNFEKLEVVVTKPEPLTIGLKLLPPLSEVVVEGGGDSRIRSRVINMPTSFERLSLTKIQNSPSPDAYDLLRSLKGVDNVQSSLTMNTFSTRGFNGSGSTRVNQIVDGMDNQAPGLNFFVGNFAGPTELDVESIELLPGASSALYGPGGMNGTILINRKDPFKYQGLSVSVKEGLIHVDERQRSRSPYHNFSLRYAKAINEKIAFSISGQYVSAKDWVANDSSNYSGEGPLGRPAKGTRTTDPNYNGVNVYGDEASVDVRQVVNNGQTIDLWAAVAAGIKQQVPQLAPGIDAVLALTPGHLNISRTGYTEKDMVADPDAKNIKLSGALHYKLGNNIQAQLSGYWGTGNTVYTGNNRYILKGIRIGQYKLELRHPNWFLRAYTTQEDAGESYSATLTAVNMNNIWKPHGAWFQEYAQNFLVPAATTWLQTYATSGAQAANNAVQTSFSNFHNMARTAADKDRPLPGSAAFKQLLEQVRTTSITKTGEGGRFYERSQLWMAEGQYNLSNLIKFAEIIIGGNAKQYVLNSKGTVFIDEPGHPVTINELGAYTMLSKTVLSDRLKLSFAGRVDKNEDFKTQFTPRATAVVKLAKDQNLRFTYQTAYRFPSTQQKYIHLDVGSYTLLGGLPWIQDYMDVKANTAYDVTTGEAFVYQNLKPEKMRSFEIGYKAFFATTTAKQGLLVDVYGYLGSYRDFLGRNILYQPSTGKFFSTVLNSSTKVKTYGYGLGLDYKLSNNFSLFFNAYSDVITDVPGGFAAYFNTPKYRLNTGVANAGFGKKGRLGFNAILRWQDAFEWEGELANGPVDAYTTVDAQISYKFPKVNSLIRLGGTNIFNKYYKTGCGNPEIGGLYYISYGFNL